MTTLAELVDETPAATAGVPVNIAFGPGGFRYVVEIADPSAGASVVWHDITEFVTGHGLTFGADQYAGRYRAAVGTLEVCTDNDDLAPWNDDTSAMFGVHVALGAGLLVRAGFIRVVAAAVVGHRPRFTNRVESWSDASGAVGQIRRHTIVSRDLMTDLVNVPIPATTSENWFDRAEQILTDAGWPFGSSIFGAQLDSGAADILTMPARAAQPNALAELDATLDPCGLVLRTNAKGRLVIQPQPGDTFHADAFTAGATGNEYTDPATVTISYLADDTGGLVAYVTDETVSPFGFASTERGIVNRLVVTDSGTYDIDDPTSIARYGYRPRSVTWIADNDAVADDILDRLANASVEATPLTTTIDLPGFMEYAAAIEYLTNVSIVHRTSAGGQIVTGDGVLRSIAEQVSPRGPDGGLYWQLELIADIDAVDVSEDLNPVTSLAAGSITDTSVSFSWVNPSQTITPTGTQARLSGTSIWLDIAYPTTTYPWAGLQPLTGYEFEVRLVRRVDGIITNVSPVERVAFATLATATPDPTGPTGGGIGVTLPTPDAGDDVEWILEETDDSVAWLTADSGTVLDGDPIGIVIPLTSFASEMLYRVKSRAGDPPAGAYVTGTEFVHECTASAVAAEVPYDDASLIAHLPQVCPADTINAFGGSAGSHGDAFGGLHARWAGGGDIAIKVSGDGFAAAGLAPGLANLGASMTMSCLVNIDNAAYATLFATGPMRLLMQPSAGGFKPLLIVNTAEAGQLTLLGSEIAESTDYHVGATYDDPTGVATLFVDGAADGTVGSTPGLLIDPLPAWWIGGSDGSWITDCAVWDSVLAVLPGGSAAPPDWANTLSHWDLSQYGTLQGSYPADDGTAQFTLSISGGAVGTLGTNALNALAFTVFNSGLYSAAGSAVSTLTTWGCSWIGLEGSQSVFFDTRNSGTARPVAYQFGTDTLDGGTLLTGSARDTTNMHMWYMEINGASSKIYRDGTLIATGTIGTPTAASAAIVFANVYNRSVGDAGTKYGEIWLTSGTQTGTKITEMSNAAKTKFGF